MIDLGEIPTSIAVINRRRWAIYKAGLIVRLPIGVIYRHNVSVVPHIKTYSMVYQLIFKIY